MSLLDQYKAAQAEEFAGKVCIAALTYALQVTAEARTTANYNKRVDLARRFANDPVTNAQKMVYLIATDPAVVAADDNTIRSLVAAVWNTMAGVEPEPVVTPAAVIE